MDAGRIPWLIWKVAEHPFRVDLGSRASVNVERLVKLAFDDVAASFDSLRGVVPNHPTLDVCVVSANRDLPKEVALRAEQWTAISGSTRSF